MKSVAFCTLGCKVNQYETDAMEELFSAAGYEIRPFGGAADIYIINTCTVTNIADRKSRQMLHRARKKNPQGIIVAAGCYVQAAKDQLLEDSAVDLIVGNNKKSEIVALVEALMQRRAQQEGAAPAADSAPDGDAAPDNDEAPGRDAASDRVNASGADAVASVIDINHTNVYETLHISRVSEHTRAYIKIQDGCNQFCSYCIIPYARGRVRSRKAEDIISEVAGLAGKGYKEIVLTGIHISSYGLDFSGEEYNDCTKDEHLTRLIEALADIPGLERIRLGSLEPRIVTEEFTKRLGAIDKICPQFHLSLQSGCDATLARMNRKYTTRQYDACCALLRKYFDRPAITTDVIVGFPGETEEEFAETEKFLEHIAFAQMHIFKYSKREGTRAASMEQQVDESIKNIRSARLLALNERLHDDFIQAWKGSPVDVLLEESVEIDGKTYMTGHTKEYIRVAMDLPEEKANSIVRGRISLKLNEDFVICESE